MGTMYFSDLHLQILARGLLEPGERVTGQVVVERAPWYGFGRFFRSVYLMMSTEQRLVLIEHTKAWFYGSFKLHKVESLPWGNVEELALKGLIAKTKLRLRAQTQSGPRNLSLKIPTLFAGIRNNAQGSKAVVAAFQGHRSLPPGRPLHGLPASLGQPRPPAAYS